MKLPYDSGGNHSLPDGTIVNTGDKILPSQHNPAMQDISASLSSVLVRDGRAGMVGNLPMGGFKTVNMGDGTDPTDGATVGQLGAAFGSQVGAATSKATPVDADYLPVYDSAAANALRKLTWANVKATLKAYFDTLYQATGTALLKAGGTMTGDLILKGNPTSNLMAATKQYVDAGDAQQIGVGQTWQDLTASRARNTVYTNSTGRPITISMCHDSSVQGDFQVSADGATWINVGVARISGDGSPVTVIIPAGWRYRTSGGINNWAELR